MKECEWLSDDFSEICCNADSPYAADFCPFHEYERKKLCNIFIEPFEVET